MRRLLCFLSLLAVCAITLDAQTLSDRFKENYKIWDLTLDRGDGSTVRRGVESLLQKEGLTVSHSDYNEMHTLVAVNQLAARACVLEGAWEDGVAFLQKAEAAAAENLRTTSESLGKLRKEHEQKLSEWKDAVAKQEPRLKELDEQPGLTKELVQQRTQVREYIEERRNSIAHSEQSIRDIDGILDWLRKDQETSTKGVAAWQTFIAKEKQEMELAGSAQKYVSEKLEQVKADDARPRFDRLAYTHRLQRLDSSNQECAKFARALLGGEEPLDTPQPKPAKKTKKKKK
jgi:hypothetical protein